MSIEEVSDRSIFMGIYGRPGETTFSLPQKNCYSVNINVITEGQVVYQPEVPLEPTEQIRYSLKKFWELKKYY